MSAEREARAAGLPGDRIASAAERAAAGWQRRFVVDQTRVVEMVKLYQGLGYETAVDPVRPEDLPGEEANEVAGGEPGRADPGCGDCQLVTLRWLHVIYTRPARGPRDG